MEGSVIANVEKWGPRQSISLKQNVERNTSIRQRFVGRLGNRLSS
jgi:hypothetical protein